jgi:hypothetical protein
LGRAAILPLLDAAVETLAPASDPKVISADQRKDLLDVQVALATGQSARLTLADGTELSAERTSSDAGNPGALAPAADLAACTLCYSESAPHLRVNGALSAQSDLTFRDLRLHASGPAPRRLRWDVIRVRSATGPAK